MITFRSVSFDYLMFTFWKQVCKRAVFGVFPTERKHQGKDYFVSTRRLWHQDKYLGEAEVDPEAEKGLCVRQRGVQEERCEHGQGHHQAHHRRVGQDHPETIQVDRSSKYNTNDAKKQQQYFTQARQKSIGPHLKGSKRIFSMSSILDRLLWSLFHHFSEPFHFQRGGPAAGFAGQMPLVPDCRPGEERGGGQPVRDDDQQEAQDRRHAQGWAGGDGGDELKDDWDKQG